MIRNDFIDLSRSSIARNDAFNSIKYTLLLDYPQIITYNPECFVAQVMEQCQNCCKGLFQDTTSQHPIYFDFFGTNARSVASCDDKTQCLSALDSFPSTSNAIPKTFGFPTMIMDHCVLSSYHAILTALLKDRTITSYELRNSIKANGVFSLYKRNHLFFQHPQKTNDKNTLSCGNKKKSSSASDFSRIAQNHLRALPYAESLFVKESSSKTTYTKEYNLQFSALFYRICRINANSWKIFLSQIDESNIYTFLEKHEELSKAISPRNVVSSSSNITQSTFAESNNPVDGLYYRYITERIFNFNLFYCLLRNIHHIEQKTNYRLCQNEILAVLTCCKDLPNIFSRQYFLQYAFNKFNDQPSSYIDFWNSHKLNTLNDPFVPVRKYTLQFQFTKWLEQFKLFCDYLSHFVIPVYEWCFLILIMDTLEKKYPNESEQFILVRALDFLADYMIKNYKTILRPINLPKAPDWIDTITKHSSGTQYFNLPTESLLYLFKAFSPVNNEINLNLSPLNPDFFKSGNIGKIDSNETRIRNFYIDLILFSN